VRVELFEVSKEEVEAGVAKALVDFTTHVDALVDQTEESTKSLLVPSVKFLIDATLATLSQPAVEARLPREVLWRQAIATQLARRAVRIFSQEDDTTAPGHQLKNIYARFKREDETL